MTDSFHCGKQDIGSGLIFVTVEDRITGLPGFCDTSVIIRMV